MYKGAEWGVVEEEEDMEGPRSSEEGRRKHLHRTEIFLLKRFLYQSLCFRILLSR